MNVDCRASALIRKVEKHYHNENLTNNQHLILKRECDNSVLGVLARGTDYTSLRPYFNPIQPDIDYTVQAK